MENIKGPAIFLAQFVGEDEPFNSLDSICKWASSLGYKGVQIPSWDIRLIDLKKASESSKGKEHVMKVSHNNIEDLLVKIDKLEKATKNDANEIDKLVRKLKEIFELVDD